MALRQYGGGKKDGSLVEYQAELDSALANLPALIMIFGPNDFLRLEAVQLLQDAWLAKHAGGEVASLRGGGDTTFADVTLKLSGNSLFAGEKLVLIRQAERLLFPSSGKEDDNEIGRAHV